MTSQCSIAFGVEILYDELKHISHLISLYEIYMNDAGILGTGLKYVAEIKSLKRLHVEDTHDGWTNIRGRVRKLY